MVLLLAVDEVAKVVTRTSYVTVPALASVRASTLMVTDETVTSNRFARANILGVGVSAINMPQAISIIDGWIQRRQHHYVCLTGVHGIVESRRDEELRQVYNRAGLSTPDGVPLVWLSKLQGFSHCARVYGPDLMVALCEHSLTSGYRHLFLGGLPGVPERLAERLSQRFPGLQIAGAISPPFRSSVEVEDLELIDTVNKLHPNIIWVGLGAPKQEKWMARHLNRFTANALIGVGAAFDFHSGLKPQAPQWMQKCGLEWLYRLGTEPRRLGPRYLKNNPRFMILVAADLLGLLKPEPLTVIRQ